MNLMLGGLSLNSTRVLDPVIRLITETVAPVLAAGTEGDTLGDILTSGTYSVDVGSIASVTYTSDGVAILLTDPAVNGEFIRAVVTDDQGNPSETFSVGTVVLAPVQITATLTPAISLIFDGQAIEDIPDFAAMTAMGNFASTGGAIQSIVVRAFDDGEEVALDSIFATEDRASFTVTVTDAASNVEVFDSGVADVEFVAHFSVTSDNTFVVTFNENVPDTVSAELIVSGLGAMDGTYDVLKADAVAGIPFVLDGSINPDYDGALSNLDTGDTITLNTGLWFAPEGVTLTLSAQAQVDGVNVGAAGDTYTLTAGDLGGAFRIEVTANDGVNPAVVEVGSAITLPAGQAGPIGITRIDNRSGTGTGSGDSRSSLTLDLAGAASDDIIRAVVGLEFADNTDGRAAELQSVLVDGVSTPIIYKTATGTSCLEIAYVEFTRGANAAPVLTNTNTQPLIVNSFYAHCFTLDKSVSVLDTDVLDNDGGANTTTVTVNTVPDGIVVVATADDNSTDGNVTFVGISDVVKDDGVNNADFFTGWHASTTTEARDVSYTSGNSPSTSMLAVSYQKA